MLNHHEIILFLILNIKLKWNIKSMSQLKVIDTGIFQFTSFYGLAYLRKNNLIIIPGSVKKTLWIRIQIQIYFWPDPDPLISYGSETLVRSEPGSGGPV